MYNTVTKSVTLCVSLCVCMGPPAMFGPESGVNV